MENGNILVPVSRKESRLLAGKNGKYGEALADTRENSCCTIVFDRQEEENIWEELRMIAPEEAAVNPSVQSEEELEQGRKKLEAAVTWRKDRETAGVLECEKICESLYRDTRTKLKDKERALRILKLAGGNRREIAEFLSRQVEKKWPEEWKLEILESLREKDYVDITAAILEEHCAYAKAYKGSVPKEIWVSYVLCPRVEDEMIRPYRKVIQEWLTREEKERIRHNPAHVRELLDEKMAAREDQEYASLISSAEGALNSGFAGEKSKKIICVQIWRTLGIPSRLNPYDGEPEFWMDGQFAAGKSGKTLMEKMEKEKAAEGIVLEKDGDRNWIYFQNWSIARFENGAYRTLELCDESGEEIYGKVPLRAGKYRILTASRLPNGNIFAKKMVITLSPGEWKEIHLEQKKAQPGDLVENNDIADFSLKRDDQTPCRLSFWWMTLTEI